MIRIDRLVLHLPSGFEHRANRIARSVAAGLATMDPARDLELPSLGVGPLELPHGASDRDVARTITLSIGSGVAGAPPDSAARNEST